MIALFKDYLFLPKRFMSPTSKYVHLPRNQKTERPNPKSTETASRLTMGPNRPNDARWCNRRRVDVDVEVTE